ncbi:Fic family protein [Candidatus Micrarchaeota archaeon]|nr:Fic family protein [Candidatus Micrarchaeota archaeon]
MKSKWDALFALFNLKKSKLKRIAEEIGSSPSSTRQRLKELEGEGLVEREKGEYQPNRENPKTWNVFNIMKFCRGRGINYNIFLSVELSKILKKGMAKEEVFLKDFKGISYKTARKYLTYLNRINLALITSKKPLKIKFIRDPILQEVLSFFGEKPRTKESKGGMAKEDYGEIKKLLKKVEETERNLLLGDVEEELRIEFASASTQLEGNTFTLDETRELVLEDIVPEDKKLREANEVKNYYNAINQLVSNISEPLSIEFILDLHRNVIHNLGVKEGIRASDVSIRGNLAYKVAHFSEILPKLDVLVKRINDFNSRGHGIAEIVEFATFVHNEFQHIHPFDDGNSRTTRLIWNYVLMNNGFPLMNIYANTKEEYLLLTKLARKRDDSKLNSFLVKTIKDNLYKRIRMELGR